MSQPRGLRQCLRYNDAAARLRYTLTGDEGLEEAPYSGNVTAALYDPAGNLIASAATMTVETASKSGFLKIKTQTAEFTIGERVTGGTSSAKGTIASQTKTGTTGVLFLVDVDGTFQNSEVLTGSVAGVAAADGTLYLATYYLDVNTAASTTTYAVGQNYRAQVTWTWATGKTRTREVLFDIAYYPATAPLVSSQEIDTLYPTLARKRKDWQDWEPAITAAHAELLRRINGLGEFAQEFIGRETDLWRVELDFVLAQIAKSMGFELEVQDRLVKDAEISWAGLGPVRKSTDSKLTTQSQPVVMSCKLVR